MKTKKPLPVVLAIDDDEQTGTQLKLLGSAEVIAKRPDEVTTSDLRKANVVLIDYQIDEWPGRDRAAAITLKPANGVALAAVLRSQSDRLITEHRDCRRAFTIHSAKLHELAGGLPAPSREHAIARILNLEWAFSKTQNPQTPPFKEQVASLAKAVKSLPVGWPTDPEKAIAVVHKILSLPAQREGWRQRAVEDVAMCHPPVHASATATRGMAVIRWLLHQVLPYPTFLWDERYLAARLHVTAESLRRVLQVQKQTLRRLSGCEYSGVLSTFLGRRWWRAGVEHMLWDWTDGDPFNNDAVQAAVKKHVSRSVEFLSISRPVVCVDESFRPTDHFVDVVNAVEVKPDDWPSFAEQAWLPAKASSTERVSALVVPQDRQRTGGSSE